MPRKKKTREQKRKADERNSALVETAVHGHVVALPTYTFSSKETAAAHVTHQEHVDSVAIVKHDLTKTLWVSVIIVVLQVVFFYLLKNHVLAINFVRY